MGDLPKYMKRVKGKTNLYFIRDFPKAYQDIIDKPRHRRSLGTADPKLAQSPFAREAAEYHRLLDAARLGKTLDSAYGKLKNKRISNMKRGLTGAKDEPDTFHIDPEDLHEPSLLIEVENYKHRMRIEELELLRDSGHKGVTEANDEIEALQCLIDGTLPSGATEGITAPLLSATIKEWEASETRDGLTLITVDHQGCSMLIT